MNRDSQTRLAGHYELLRTCGNIFLDYRRKTFPNCPLDFSLTHNALAQACFWNHYDKVKAKAEAEAPIPDGNDLLGLTMGGVWVASGRPIFCVMEDFSVKALLTDIDGLTTSDFVLPFNLFFIELPPNSSITLPGKTSPLTAIAVNRTKIITPSLEALSSTFLKTMPRIPEGNCAVAKSVLSSFTDLDEATPKGYSLVIVCYFEDGSTWLYPITCLNEEQDKPLSTWIYREDECMVLEKPYVIDFKSNTPRILTNLVVNTCVALSSRVDTEYSLREHIKKSDSRKAYHDPIRWDLGSKIKVDPELKRAAQARSRGETSAEWAKYASHVVRGHHKRQPCGKGSQDRKIITVHPYVRGNTDVAPRPHHFTVT